MNKAKHLKVEVTQNSLAKTVSLVPQWEAHVLLAIWGEDAQIVGEEIAERKIPEAQDEFARLANKYGPKDDDTPFVARVYGNFGPGVRALGNEIEANSGANARLTPEPAPELEVAVESQASEVAGPEPEVFNPAVENGAIAKPAEENAGAADLLPPGVTLDQLVSKHKQDDISDLTG